ncbi:UNVERIFIED_CONTAM: Mediator of RNA polymerase II transcription subunit [Sesamum angustifolium]|uniref:Mediator of RNA polymerase II transcription subunit 13 n=1 Tax=Sesamum angustifolium TaxID=2727405 RepID=A0AAW2QD07_9LAMI
MIVPYMNSSTLQTFVGGLHQISWFQFLPHEFDFNTLPDRVDQKDAATLAVLSAHVQLQKEGFLSTWTNSFVGPWDPSQGLHNPDEKIKLWLFLPGQHSSIVEKAQPSVARLRVLASGLWVAPGDSEEVAAALSQALRNCIERFWLQNWVGPALSGSSLFMHCNDKVDSRGESSLEPSGTRSQHGYRSSSNSNSSSNCSISSSSSDSEPKTLGAGDPEADADSLMSRQSGLSSLGHMQNDGLHLMSYYVVCPNIDPLTTAATDFFLQLGTVYETCKLGTHAPQSPGNEMEIDSGKISPSGFVLLDCPQSMKIETNNASILGSISDYFLCLSNGWDLTSYLKTLSKVLKTLKLGSSVPVNAKEGNGGPCTVVYVVCPFPEPLAVLQTVVESSIAIGSVIRSSDKERRSLMHNQVAKALSYPAAVDESFSNVFTLTGFSIPKLVLQIVTVDAIFRVTSPTLNELIILKEIAFTVYNKARRISRGASGETAPSLAVPGRSHSALMQMASPVPGMWKDCVGPRIGGPPLQRESELDASLRPGSWDNSWQTARSGGLGLDANRTGDVFPLDEIRCLFEPLFILAEPGSLERGLSPFSGNIVDSAKLLSDDCASTSFVQSSASSGSGDNGPVSQPDSLDSDGFGSGHQKTLPSLHCCYGWTEDWRWMVCIWTDSRGELLDSYVYPFGGISSRQDTKGLQSLFIQILQQGCQILQACSPDVGIAKPRDLVITRIGCFFELECQEWQKALYSAGGSDVKKWSLQLRRSFPDGISPSSNGNSLQQQEMSLMQERTLPSSPSPLYSSHPKASAFMKGGIAQPSSRKPLMGGHAVLDNSKGLLQWVQSISFVSVSIDHSLQLVFQADSTLPGTSQASTTSSQSGYLEGYTPVKSLGSTSASYVLIPSPSMRFLPPAILQLPTCLTADSPPLAHLLHSKGSAIPLSTGFVVSKAVPSMRKDYRSLSKEEWPSILSVSLVDYYGGNNFSQEKIVKGVNKQVGRSMNSDAKDFEVETHMILESITAELHSLSWMTVSPAYLERRSALPFHCDMVLRLRRLLHFADKELSRLPEKARV